MMKKAIAKLKSENGVSILIAILYLLAASMVISVILAAANTSVKNFNSEHKQQQAYLTVSSAALYMRDELASYTYTITKAKDGTKTQAYDVDNTADTKADACHFKPLMDAAMDAFDIDGQTSFQADFKLSLTNTVKNRQNKYAFEPVSVTFIMAPDRDIDVTLTIYETEENKEDNIYYQMTISLPSDSWESTVEDGAKKTEWTWSKGNILRGTAS